ncbi:Fe-S cluster-binding ribosome biosynthesis protein [Coemansia sp. S610]|uniref:Translation initiation factor RLI1 n=1 Tax=Coemansia spiralis TaxID=417178 RepID=A0A9W8L4J5_9FUNG|nr:Fe-S cluster-binding ribosome biosynthesis protein [Coemansia sp. RSA 2675]KAJ2020123.1 Fe-S cluster-binding ribosome biosynthesis protein [Coemansia sp. S85]KAJ2025834.1 Fe-S cluster-binding ribosome biosynthesis protein [Coemansia sp. S610]KAJ2416912.1 Fe-S cluster-binding ribosome biosynthesis protein [Coemansia sp. RSA 2530]KAJ2688199.1 Fe-S cluster-binding ribosome biosynthesis protein [Coemansia spiralis]KAJ2697295.1 Fe-S cluster-binding ribosome biosynthesis protein [Coemansia sp. IM
MAESNSRIAIVNNDKCKPKKCKQECKRVCPVVKMGKQCIIAEATSKIANISESLCIGCGMCVKRCPFGAITIINLPTNLEKETTHRYGANSFKLHRLPMPRPGQVLGLVGANGTGKSTALKILSGQTKPNLGNFADPPEWTEIIRHFRGSELQNYFTKILEDNLKAIIKPQSVDAIAKKVPMPVGPALEFKAQRDNMEYLIRELDLHDILNREVKLLSGGELQRFAIAVACVQQADVYMFDEPSSYLDVKQRLNAARVIRSLVDSTTYVIAIEHDLAVLDYLSDFVCMLYGTPSVYGVVTMPFSVREGINVFLAGMLPTENLRFREEELTFRIAEQAQDEEEVRRYRDYPYPKMTKTQGNFKLSVVGDMFSESEIIVLLGENGTGKTTLINLLAGNIATDKGEKLDNLKVSFKPQKIAPKFQGTVRLLMHKVIGEVFVSPTFQREVVKPMQIEEILDNDVQNLSGGELQRVALVLALGKPADVYLLDEPSAYLDSEQRINASKVIKRFIMSSKKTAFVVEHDFIMATYLADRVIVMEGTPSVRAKANAPQALLTGMNKFLRSLNITFRRDPTNYRPRINKLDSAKDREQKSTGNFFFLED